MIVRHPCSPSEIARMKIYVLSPLYRLHEMLLQTPFAHVPLKVFMQILGSQNVGSQLLDENALISYVLVQVMLIIHHHHHHHHRVSKDTCFSLCHLHEMLLLMSAPPKSLALAMEQRVYVYVQGAERLEASAEL